MPSLETLKIVGVFYARFITIKESFSLKEQYGILLFRYYYLGNLFFFFLLQGKCVICENGNLVAQSSSARENIYCCEVPLFSSRD